MSAAPDQCSFPVDDCVLPAACSTKTMWETSDCSTAKSKNVIAFSLDLLDRLTKFRGRKGLVIIRQQKFRTYIFIDLIEGSKIAMSEDMFDAHPQIRQFSRVSSAYMRSRNLHFLADILNSFSPKPTIYLFNQSDSTSGELFIFIFIVNHTFFEIMKHQRELFARLDPLAKVKPVIERNASGSTSDFKTNFDLFREHKQSIGVRVSLIEKRQEGNGSLLTRYCELAPDAYPRDESSQQCDERTDQRLVAAKPEFEAASGFVDLCCPDGVFVPADALHAGLKRDRQQEQQRCASPCRPASHFAIAHHALEHAQPSRSLIASVAVHWAVRTVPATSLAE